MTKKKLQELIDITLHQKVHARAKIEDPQSYSAGVLDGEIRILNLVASKYLKAKPEISETEFSRCLTLYVEFCGIAPKIDKVDRMALSDIITYIKQNITHNADAGQVFKLILDNWEKLPSGMRHWRALKQINKNLFNIITFLKLNHEQRVKQSTAYKQAEYTQIATELLYRQNSKKEREQ